MKEKINCLESANAIIEHFAGHCGSVMVGDYSGSQFYHASFLFRLIT